MKVHIALCRVRDGGLAEAPIAAVTCEASDEAAAVGMARSPFRKLEMRQTPGLMRVFDGAWRELFRSVSEGMQ
jgi:hypothetical protein